MTTLTKDQMNTLARVYDFLISLAEQQQEATQGKIFEAHSSATNENVSTQKKSKQREDTVDQV